MTHAFRRALRRVGVRVYRVLARELSSGAAPAPPGIEMRLLLPSDANLFSASPGLGLTEDKVPAAFQRGEVCVGAFAGGELVAYGWFAYQAAPHVEGIWMDFDRRAIYIYRAFVHPAWRGRGIAPALYRFADELFVRNGRSVVLICVEGDNRASVRAAERSGARTAGHTGYVHLFGKLLTVRSPGAARVGFRFYRGD
jgi:ribosomal protein S18 acetylase RimI-like enzyme